MGYFKWTEQTDQQLIELRLEKVPLTRCATILGVTYDAVKHRASKLIKDGKLSCTPLNERRVAPKIYTVQNLLDYVRQYVSNDACPNDIKHQVRKQFGSWGAALEAAGLTGNIGGKMDLDKPTTLYLLDFGEFKKVGITQRELKQRFTGAPAYTVLDTVTTTLEQAVEFETAVLNTVKSRQFVPADLYFERRGKTECFIGCETQLEQLL